MLERFKNSREVMLVSGNNFAPRQRLNNTYYFSSHANIWGWATWARTWSEFRGKDLRTSWYEGEIQQVAKMIPAKSQRRSFTGLMRSVGQLDSWAISFAAFGYLNRKLSVVPFQNLVTNVGFGAESTHTKFESFADEVPLGRISLPLVHPPRIEPNLAEMKRESRLKSLGWITFPILHPIDFLGRVLRYLKLRVSK